MTEHQNNKTDVLTRLLQAQEAALTRVLQDVEAPIHAVVRSVFTHDVDIESVFKRVDQELRAMEGVDE